MGAEEKSTAKHGAPGGFIDSGLMKALSDEIRVQIFAYLCDHTARMSEVAAALDLPQNVVRHHVTSLRNGGFIAVDPSVSKSGYHYRAIRAMLIPPNVWTRLPELARHKLAAHMLRDLYSEIGASSEAGFFLRPGLFMSLTPMVVDAQGQRDARHVLEEALKELAGIQRESDARRAAARTDKSGISMTAGLLGFESLRSPASGARPSATMRL
jgi:DNA-binding transcriptional ArsR family regulator